MCVKLVQKNMARKSTRSVRKFIRGNNLRANNRAERMTERYFLRKKDVLVVCAGDEEHDGSTEELSHAVLGRWFGWCRGNV